MRSLYIAATEASAGKTTLALGLCRALKARGIDVGYFKPVGDGTERPPGMPDDDAVFVQAALDLAEDPFDLCPVRLGEAALELTRPGKEDPRAAVRRTYAEMAARHDLLVCEGLGEVWQGRFVRMSGADVTSLLDLRALLVARFSGARQLDDVCYVHDVIKDRLVGVVFTMVPETRMEAVEHQFAPFLAENCVPSLGAIPTEPVLASIPVGLIAAELGGRFLTGEEDAERLAETFLIGAMSPQHALPYFERTPNKVVVVGGDRDDLILVALRTSTAALVLTGDFTPSAKVVERAAGLGVALISVPQDTADAADGLRRLFGSLRIHEPAKIDHIERLVTDRVDVDRLLEALA
jgi:BioD-like phosphotransacetylase family protein